ncbi:hypothetical protein GCM10020258_47170 [Sphingomonas yabuuchiae]
MKADAEAQSRRDRPSPQIERGDVEGQDAVHQRAAMLKLERRVEIGQPRPRRRRRRDRGDQHPRAPSTGERQDHRQEKE